MHELLGGAGVARQDDVFLDQVDLDLELVEGHPVLEVAVEPVGLLDQQDADGRMRLEEREHLAEPGAAGPLGGLDVHELCATAKPLRRGVSCRSFSWAGIEKPSFSCSLDETFDRAAAAAPTAPPAPPMFSITTVPS